MSSPLQTELDTILHGAAIFPLTDRAFLRITGPDATRWLNGMVTNNIKDLAPGEGNYNFLLNNQGRIQGDCTIYREYREPESGDARYLLQTDASQIDTIQQLLDKFIIMDDVELSRELVVQGSSFPQEMFKGFAVIGKTADELFGKVMGEILNEFLLVDLPKAGTLVWGTYAGTPSFVLSPPETKKAVEVWSSYSDLDAVRTEFQKLGAIELSPAAIEAYRILSGTPKYGVDIRNTDTAKDLPQETAQTHALHFTKGCYLGQEIVERIHSRGQVHRTFTTFSLSALPATLPSPLTAEGKPAGELTSAITIGDQTFALGYIRREALDRLNFDGGTATPTPVPISLI